MTTTLPARDNTDNSKDNTDDNNDATPTRRDNINHNDDEDDAMRQ